jgi:hypothetical protein
MFQMTGVLADGITDEEPPGDSAVGYGEMTCCLIIEVRLY